MRILIWPVLVLWLSANIYLLLGGGNLKENLWHR